MPNMRERQKEGVQKTQVHYYDRNARDLPILDEGETIRMKPFTLDKKGWKKTVVIKRLDERLCEVETAAGASSNRAHLRMTKEPPPSTIMDDIPGVMEGSSRQHKPDLL